MSASSVQARKCSIAEATCWRGSLSAVVIAQRLGTDHTAPVCRRLADLGIPFVFHTRYDVTEAKQNWPDAPVVKKPASPRELVRAVVGLLT